MKVFNWHKIASLIQKARNVAQKQLLCQDCKFTCCIVNMVLRLREQKLRGGFRIVSRRPSAQLMHVCVT